MATSHGLEYETPGAHHGGVINDTLQRINQLGLDNSSARLLPKDTVLPLPNCVGGLRDKAGASYGDQSGLRDMVLLATAL